MLPCFVSRFLGESPHLKWFITMVIRCFKLFIDGISQGMGTYDQQACDLTASDGESSPTWAVFLRREGQVELRKKSGGWIILINRDLLWDSFSLWSHGHVVGIRHFQTPSCWTTFFSQRWEFTWHLIRVYTYIYIYTPQLLYNILYIHTSMTLYMAREIGIQVSMYGYWSIETSSVWAWLVKQVPPHWWMVDEWSSFWNWGH